MVKTLVALVYNSKACDRLWVTDATISGLIDTGFDVVVADDSVDKQESVKHFAGLGCKVFHYDTSKLKTVEERISFCKNKLREYFLNCGQYDNVFWYESDLYVTPLNLLSLESSGLDNVTAIRPQHGGMLNIFPFNDMFPRDSWISRKLPNLMVVNHDFVAYKNSRFIELSCYGMGSSIVSRKATEQASFWCKPFSPCTHDIAYSMDLYSLGIKCYCDTTQTCPHYFVPLRKPDERIDFGGNWDNIDSFRAGSVQAELLNG